MFVKVIFHGALKRICPDKYKVDVSTPSEAIRAVTNQFKDKLIRKDRQRFVCSVKECPRDVDLNNTLRTDELNIYPAFCASGGGKGANWGMIAIGVVLVAAAILLGPAGWAMAGTGFGVIGATTAGVMASVGVSMMLSGISGLLFTPKLDTARSSNNPESSRTFGNSANTTKIGTRIPVGYGLYKVAGQYLSINTSAEDVQTAGVKRSSKW